jgi:uncharacterized integral membrane protein (TIGR00698 family)
MPQATLLPGSEAARSATVVPGLFVTAVGVVTAVLLHEVVDAVGVLTWSVLLGALAANLGLLPRSTGPGLRFAVRRLLRLGVVLLGFSLSVGSIAALGLPVIALVVVTLACTLVATFWLGQRIALGRPRSLLIATGFAICGASAIAAMQDNAEADEDDVASAVALVTIWGTVAMVAVPLLQAPLGLSDPQLGVWAGASVHEVGQVVAAAGPAGATAVAVAVAVKLTRVLLLAPVVAGVSVLRRRRSTSDTSNRPALVPMFVLGFLACVALRSLGVVPVPALAAIEQAQTLTLSAALFGLGTGVHLASLLRTGGRALTLGAVSTVLIAGVSLPFVLWLV